MTLFVIGLVLLVVGYYTYGRFVEKVLGPDDRETPAVKNYDGVDFMPLPHWKNMLIQLLNIAGIGPVIGVIAGIKFGAIVFILIPIGNIIGGATHDFISGMASLRNRGSNLPAFVRSNLGVAPYRFFSVFMVFLLLLVVTVFINVPANLIDKSFNPEPSAFWYAVVTIFLYYIAATMFPVDKIIGRFYPIFGALLLIGSGALLVSLIMAGIKDPSILVESEAFVRNKATYLQTNPLIPCLFVTIACGILSGFHATQSPIIARTMKTERQARSSFYGMMVVEGIIAMVWAGAALAIYNRFPEFWNEKEVASLIRITTYFLGSKLGTVTIIAVVILAITSGDTAMRSMRLSLAEIIKLDQKPFQNRLLLCIPLIALVAALLAWSNVDNESFNKLWRYFAWANQALAVFTLGSGIIWLYSQKKAGWISAIPCLFYCFIVLSFIFWTSKDHGGPAGLGLDLHVSYAIAAVISVAFVAWCFGRGISRGRAGNAIAESSEPEQASDEKSAE